MTPAFKKLDIKHWLRWEKAEAKKFRKAMKKRDAPNCEAVEVFRGPPEPFYIYKPYFPVLAESSGSCSVRFNINQRGNTTDIQPLCSDDAYRESAEQAISHWWFKSEAAREAIAANPCGYEVKLKFQLEE